MSMLPTGTPVLLATSARSVSTFVKCSPLPDTPHSAAGRTQRTTSEQCARVDSSRGAECLGSELIDYALCVRVSVRRRPSRRLYFAVFMIGARNDSTEPSKRSSIVNSSGLVAGAANGPFCTAVGRTACRRE